RRASQARGPRADVVRGAIEACRLEAREPAGVRLGGSGDAVRAEKVAIGLASPRRPTTTPSPRSSVQSLRSGQGPRASPPDHRRITHSRHRTALGGHRRTPAWSIPYSRGRRGSLWHAGGHGTRTGWERALGSFPRSGWQIRQLTPTVASTRGATKKP